MSSLRLTKHQANVLANYIEHVEELLEALAMDDELSHMIVDGLEDEHFTLRLMCDEMLKREE